MQDELLRAPAVAEMTGIPEATWRFWRATNKAGVPKSINIGGRRVVWRRSDIEHWIADQFEAAK